MKDDSPHTLTHPQKSVFQKKCKIDISVSNLKPINFRNQLKKISNEMEKIYFIILNNLLIIIYYILMSTGSTSASTTP